MKFTIAISSVFAAALAMAVLFAAAAPTPQDNILAKPFGQYQINDVFPKVVNPLAGSGSRWSSAAADIQKDAESRKRMVEMAAETKKTEVSGAKDQLKQAKRERDLVRIGMLEGVIRNEELSIDILAQLERVTERQIEAAEALSKAGEAVEKFTEADNAFDVFRSRQLIRPDAGQTDQRLGPDGYEAFREKTDAMKDLGKAFKELGSRTESLAEERRKLMETLAKGGHIQSAATR